MTSRSPLRAALQDMALIVDIVSHTPNEVRSPKWWAIVRQRVCERHGIPTLHRSSAGVRVSRSRPVLFPQMVRVLELAAEGHTTKETSQILGLTANTVKTHKARSMKALGANNITHAVALAIRAGIIEGESSEPSEQEIRDLDRDIERDTDPAHNRGPDGDGERDSVREGPDLSRDLI